MYMVVINTLPKPREVREIQISVVGSISNQQEVKEIETVAKVFVVAERIIDLTYDQKSISATKPPIIPPKKLNKCQKPSNSWSHFLTIHGFN
jgi:hypothetical protein